MVLTRVWSSCYRDSMKPSQFIIQRMFNIKKRLKITALQEYIMPIAPFTINDDAVLIKFNNYTKRMKYIYCGDYKSHSLSSLDIYIYMNIKLRVSKLFIEWIQVKWYALTQQELNAEVHSVFSHHSQMKNCDSFYMGHTSRCYTSNKSEL